MRKQCINLFFSGKDSCDLGGGVFSQQCGQSFGREIEEKFTAGEIDLHTAANGGFSQNTGLFFQAGDKGAFESGIQS